MRLSDDLRARLLTGTVTALKPLYYDPPRILPRSIPHVSGEFGIDQFMTAYKANAR